jgi:hypothetical protein
VTDISSGVDGQLWALDCDTSTDLKDFQIIKWNPFTERWYLVEGMRARRLSAYNEISVAVLGSNNHIFVSSEKHLNYPPAEYSENNIAPVYWFSDSTLAPKNTTALTYLNSILPPNLYKTALLVYRASRDGFEGKNFHQRVDNSGPTVTLIKSNNNVFGAYV